MSAIRHAFARLSTGVTLHYAEHGDPQGDPVVCLHGWPDSWFTFSRMLDCVPERFRVLVPDQRGFGDSVVPSDVVSGFSRTRLSEFSIDALAGDVAAFCDAVSTGSVTVVGHSFGSFVARRFAIAHPDRVRRLALIGTGFTAANAVTTGLRSAISSLPDPVPEAFAREFQSSTAYLPLPDSFFDRIVAESQKLRAPLWRATLEGLLAYDDREQLATLRPQTLLIWGDHDALFSREDQAQLCGVIPRVTFREYAETGHCPNWERPEKTAADLVEFVEDRCATIL
jgi:pimeloyl-ACP methyl ester carboxylesterase